MILVHALNKQSKSHSDLVWTLKRTGESPFPPLWWPKIKAQVTQKLWTKVIQGATEPPIANLPLTVHGTSARTNTHRRTARITLVWDKLPESDYLSNLTLLSLTIWVLHQPEEFGSSYFPCLMRVSGFQQRCNSHPPTCPHSFSASFSFCQPVVIVSTNGPGCHCKCQLKHSRSRSFSLTTNSGSVWARTGPNPYRKIWLTLRTHGTEPCHQLRIQLCTHWPEQIKKVPDWMSEYMSDRMSNRVSEYMSSRMSTYVSDNARCSIRIYAI